MKSGPFLVDDDDLERRIEAALAPKPPTEVGELRLDLAGDRKLISTGLGINIQIARAVANIRLYLQICMALLVAILAILLW